MTSFAVNLKSKGISMGYNNLSNFLDKFIKSEPFHLFSMDISVVIKETFLNDIHIVCYTNNERMCPSSQNK